MISLQQKHNKLEVTKARDIYNAIFDAAAALLTIFIKKETNDG